MYYSLCVRFVLVAEPTVSVQMEDSPQLAELTQY